MFVGKNKLQKLDDLICTYFGQDYDLFDEGDNIDTKFDFHLAETGKAIHQELLLEIDNFLKQSKDITKDFQTH